MTPISRRQVLAGAATVPLSSLLAQNLAPRAAAAQNREAAVPDVSLTWLEGKPSGATTTSYG